MLSSHRLDFGRVGDVCNVVLAVPGVELQQLVEGHGAIVGVDELAGEVFGRGEFHHHGPAVVDVFDDGERSVDGEAGVRQQRPGLFVVGLDGGLVLGESPTEAQEGIHVRIGDVVDELAQGPAAFAIGNVELVAIEGGEGGLELLGEVADVGNGGLAGGVIGERGEGELPHGVARV